MVLAKFTDEEIKYIAGEPEEITWRREHYEAQKSMLEQGQAAFRRAIGQVG
jgi:hypothetical protein